MKIARESWLLAAVCTLDLITTIWFVQRGNASEGNPVMRFYLERGIVPFALAKMLLFLGPLAVLEWARRRNPRFVRTMLRLGIALYVGAYGGVVWRINRPGEPIPTEAQLIAMKEWAESAPTAQDIALMRSARNN